MCDPCRLRVDEFVQFVRLDRHAIATNARATAVQRACEKATMAGIVGLARAGVNVAPDVTPIPP